MLAGLVATALVHTFRNLSGIELRPLAAGETFAGAVMPFTLALAGGGLALWTYGRRRSKFPDAEELALLELTPEEEARLERLIAEQTSPERPPELPPIASGPVSAKTFGQS